MRALSPLQWLTFLLAVVYVVSPVDVLPELLLGPFGLVDDAAAIAVIVMLLKQFTRARHQNDIIIVDPVTGHML